ncbi:alpha/beta hydrolase [Aquimarina algiphila]|uniref:alpha/beta hydrolase n=1 Tax=Aquimarina algiphila TaxID=2047982 RepID=UPI0023301BFD|nr:alpha/beta hydrolase [Aquimarina algiphila]
MKKTIVLIILLIASQFSKAQQIKDFYYAELETKNLPVFVRGNLESNKILLYIQGGRADNGIDFGRSDYPKWKNTLEKKVAIAYFDQRGLNRSVKKIDTSKINKRQISKDIIVIAKSLHKKYEADIYLFGHSFGGVKVLECLANFPEETSLIKSGIVFNAPITTDFSPGRYNYYRPLYLKNLAKEFIEQDDNNFFWQEAYDWMVQTDSIATIEDSRKWNGYVDKAYQPIKRKTGLGMVFNVIFSKPYNPIKYLNNKDNKFVSDKLWYTEKKLWDSKKNTTMWELLPKIQHPILLITGRYDAVAIPEEQEEAHRLIKDSNLVIIPNCTHESYIVKADLFNKAVLSFLNLGNN